MSAQPMVLQYLLEVEHEFPDASKVFMEELAHLWKKVCDEHYRTYIGERAVGSAQVVSITRIK